MSGTFDPAQDPTRLSAGHVSTLRLVDGFEAGRRERAAAEAVEIRLLADAAAAVSTPAGANLELRRRCELERRALIADLATATRVSEWTITRLLSEAADLCARFAAGVDALERGVISRQHLAVIHDHGDRIDDDRARDEFVQAAIDRAATLTPGRLAPVLKAIAERFLQQPLAERHAAAVATRDVRVIDLADGMATLWLTHDAVLVHGIHDRLTAQARSVIAARDTDHHAYDTEDDPGEDGDFEAAGRGDGDSDEDGTSPEPVDTRTMDQLRADIATDLLLTAGPDDCVAGDGLAAIRATVQVTVPVLTMTGTSTEPALLAGYGPIDPDTARTLAASTPAWERVMTSPLTGAVLHVDRYRPGPALDRHLAARDELCRFPGCRMPVRRCDIDHTIDHAHGGPTAHTNLAHLCRRHHVLKHHTAWTVQQTSPGVLIWTSPTGRRHTDHPEPTVRFTPDPDTLERRRTMQQPWLFDTTYPPDTSPPF